MPAFLMVYCLGSLKNVCIFDQFFQLFFEIFLQIFKNFYEIFRIFTNFTKNSDIFDQNVTYPFLRDACF